MKTAKNVYHNFHECVGTSFSNISFHIVLYAVSLPYVIVASQ